MTATQPMFPLFTERFLRPALANEPAALNTSQIEQLSNENRSSSLNLAPKIGGLRALDLRSLPKDDGPPTELRTRKEKLARFEKECTPVGDNIFVGAEAVAKSRQILNDAGITHVVNCVGFLYPPYFEDEVKYQTLYLQDSPKEDILCVMYDVFDFIEAAKASEEDGRVLIHCSQGISRSAALAIAYFMWKNKLPYHDVFDDIKSKRGVANPNIGFCFQLITWHKRFNEEADKTRLYRIYPQSTSAPQYLVPKLSNKDISAASLDPRGAFVVHTPTALYVWSGAQCPDAFTAAAQRFAGQLQKYEDAADPCVILEQGNESEEFWQALNATKPEDRTVSQVKAYDGDYLVYSRSLGSPMHQGDTCDSARSGRKTPRSYAGDYMNSPNDRLRKQARSDVAASLERSNSKQGAGLESAAGTTNDGQPDRLDSARAQLTFKNAGDETSRRSSLPSPTSDDAPLLAPRGENPRKLPAVLPPLNLQQLKQVEALASPRSSPAGQPNSARGDGSNSPATNNNSNSKKGGNGGKKGTGGKGGGNSSRLSGRRPVPKINLPLK